MTTEQTTTDTEETVDLEALEKSANDLYQSSLLGKEMVKGFNLSNGTTFDERGSNQGTQPGSGDVGAVDALQIVGRARAAAAKMLKDKGMSDAEIGKFVAKMFGDDDEEEAGDEAEKSRRAADDLVKAAMAKAGGPVATNVEPILKEIFAGTAHALDKTRVEHGAFAKSQVNFNEKLSKAFVQLAGEHRKMQNLVKAIAEKAGVAIEAIERMPVTPKAKTKAGDAAPLAKGNADGSAKGEATTLPRKQLASVLSYMGIIKGIQVIDGTESTLMKSSLIAGGGTCEPGVMEAALRFLQTHPNEAQKALNYV